MKRVFLDNDVLLDYLLSRGSFASPAERILSLSAEGKISLFVSSLTFSNTHYMMRKVHSQDEIRKFFRDLISYISVAAVTSETIAKAVNSEIRDFEDAIQDACAEQLGKVDLFVTRNIKDYKKSNLKVVKPEEAMVMLSI